MSQYLTIDNLSREYALGNDSLFTTKARGLLDVRRYVMLRH